MVNHAGEFGICTQGMFAKTVVFLRFAGGPSRDKFLEFAAALGHAQETDQTPWNCDRE